MKSGCVGYLLLTVNRRRLWAEPVSSAIHVVSLANEAHLGAAVQVVEASILVQMSTILVCIAQPVLGSAVRLPWHPAPGNNTEKARHQGNGRLSYRLVYSS